MALALGCAAVACGGCGAEPDDEERVAAAAEAFYRAVATGDGENACRQLTPSTAETLEREEQALCAEAVLEVSLSGPAPASTATVYITSARVRMDSGDVAFLDETEEGWRVAAAGCKAQPGEERPDDCEL